MYIHINVQHNHMYMYMYTYSMSITCIGSGDKPDVDKLQNKKIINKNNQHITLTIPYMYTVHVYT